MRVRLVLMLGLSLVLPGCGLFAIKPQQEKLDALCSIEGRVAAASPQASSLVVVLGRQKSAEWTQPGSWEIVDHFVLDQPGAWRFHTGPGRYGLVAFQDVNRDLKYQPGEPFLRLEESRMLSCEAGQRHDNIALSIPVDGRSRINEIIDVATLQVRSPDEQIAQSLGQWTAVGEVRPLSDPHFAEEIALDGLWRPFDFLFKGQPGVYFLEPYDKNKIPVIFVHGINSSPRLFNTIINSLDRNRFQPWVFYYPSGAHLATSADLLTQTVQKLQVRYGFKSMVVVAHSMGGVVSRGFLQRYTRAGGRASIPLFVSLSTPWAGHSAAAIGVSMSPAVARVWVDMAPGSEYLRSLYASDLGVPHELWFSFKQSGVSLSEANDGTVTLASQLLPQAQQAATRLEGFEETHRGVLESAAVIERLNAVLAKVTR
ncbi:MAG TPA: alpha/beta hydrolase [Burkholderiales bacterium]|nr:alpha/beta hydrolase [Burkholderiales bacterium]